MGEPAMARSPDPREAAELLPLRLIVDGRGRLLPLEEQVDVPFPIRRVYFLLDAPPGTSRGFHTHRRLEQLLVCLSGSCRVVLDDGDWRREYVLDGPTHGLPIGPMVWREIHDFAPGTVVAVLASAPHDEDDYIRSYDEFLREVRR